MSSENLMRTFTNRDMLEIKYKDEPKYSQPVWWRVEYEIKHDNWREYWSVYQRGVHQMDAYDRMKDCLKYPVVCIMEVDDRGEYRNV